MRRGVPAVLVAVLLALVLVTGGLLAVSPAQARLVTLCTGYAGCAQQGYSDAGYAQNSATMYWGQYPGHNCTNYVAYRLITTNGMSTRKPWSGFGNAFTWGEYNAAITDDLPAPGSVAWWPRGIGLGSTQGHVSYVEKVVSHDEIWVSDDSASGDFHWRKITRAGGYWPAGFIHFADTGTPPPGPGGFVDVSPHHTFAAEIAWLSTSGVTTGYDDGVTKTYRPQQPVLREQMAAFLHRMAGRPPVEAVPSVSPFTDVDPSHVFYAEIVWLSRSGITTGYDDGSFRPGEPVLREQMAAFLLRMTGQPVPPEPGTSRFVDVRTDDVFAPHVDWLAATGITTGYVDGTFRPQQPVLREQMAAFLYRYDARF